MTWLKPLPLGKISIWTRDAIIEESKKYSSRTEFAQNNPTAYQHACKDKKHPDVEDALMRWAEYVENFGRAMSVWSLCGAQVLPHFINACFIDIYMRFVQCAVFYYLMWMNL